MTVELILIGIILAFMLSVHIYTVLKIQQLETFLSDTDARVSNAGYRIDKAVLSTAKHKLVLSQMQTSMTLIHKIIDKIITNNNLALPKEEVIQRDLIVELKNNIPVFIE